MHVLAVAQGLVEPFGRNHVEVLGLLRELCYVVVRTAAHAAAQHFAREERDVVPEAQVLDDVVVDALDLGGPATITGICFSLVEDDALDDAILLRLLGHFDQATVGVSAVFVDALRHPALLRPRIICIVILVEQLDAATCNGHHDDAHLDLGIGFFDHGTAEVIRRPEFCSLAVGKRRSGLGPLSLGLSRTGAVV